MAEKLANFKNEQDNDTIGFPSIMSGIAGDFAKLYSDILEVPAHFFYMGFLVCLGSILSDRLTLASEISPQSRIYALLIGGSSEVRKTTAINKTTEFFRDAVEDFQVCFGVGSAEGLQKKLDGQKPLLLCLDEFKSFVSKCGIRGSVLLPCVNSLFESNYYENVTAKSEIKLRNARLSLLAASTVETYRQTWDSSFTDIGFNNRLFLVPGTGERKHSFPVQVDGDLRYRLKLGLREILRHVGNGLQLDITDDARKLFHDWYMNLERSIHTKRLDTYAMRFMTLLSVNQLKRKIDIDIINKTISLMDWQLAVRREYDPIDAEGTIARMEEAIRRQLSRQSLAERDLKRKVNYNRYGLWVFETAKKNLVRSREIVWNKNHKRWFLTL